MSFTIEGLDHLKDILRLAGQQGPKLLAGPLWRFVQQHVVRVSREEYVPVVTSTLKNSIQTYGPEFSEQSVTVYAGAGNNAVKYAISVHENPRSGKTEGFSPSGKKYAPGTWSKVGQWKYLETPAKLAAAHPGPLIQDVEKEVENWFRSHK